MGISLNEVLRMMHCEEQGVRLVAQGNYCQVWMPGFNPALRIKKVERPEPFGEAEALRVLLLVGEYRSRLEALGVRTAEIVRSDVENVPGGCFPVIIAQSAGRRTLAEIIRHGQEAEAVAAVEMICDKIRPILDARPMRVGVSPNPADFVIGLRDEVTYVDLTPPLYEEALQDLHLGYKVEELKQRFFTPSGVMAELRGHVAALRPGLEDRVPSLCLCGGTC